MARPPASPDPYAVLGVPRGASHRTIREAYVRIGQETEPLQDRAGDPARFLQASRAFALLNDPERRAIFDRTGEWTEVPGEPPEASDLQRAWDGFARDADAETTELAEWELESGGAVMDDLEPSGWDDDRRGPGDPGDPGDPADPGDLRARALGAAERRWRRWRRWQEAAASVGVEDATRSLREALAVMGDAERRLAPVLEEGIGVLATEAGFARRRLEPEERRREAVAIGGTVVDGAVLVVLGAAIWIGGRLAAPTLAGVAEDGGTWWKLLASTHPAVLAVLPAAAGITLGVLRARVRSVWARTVLSTPLALAAAASALALGALCYVVTIFRFGGATSPATEMLSALISIMVGLLPFILFVLASGLSEDVRALVSGTVERRNRRILRGFDSAAARFEDYMRALGDVVDHSAWLQPQLATLSERTDRARSRPESREAPGAVAAALTLLGHVAVSGIWIASAALAVALTLGALLPLAPLWVGLAGAATIAGLCAAGALVPHRRPGPGLAGTRGRGAAALAPLAGVLALVGLIVGVAGPQPGPEWALLPATATAFLASLRLRASIGPTRLAAGMALAAALALLLWPLTLAGPARGARVRRPVVRARPASPIPRF